MEKKIAELEFSKEGGLDLAFVEKKLRLTISYDGKGVDAGVYADVDPEYFLDKLKAAIPGEIDDTVIDLLKAALLK